MAMNKVREFSVAGLGTQIEIDIDMIEFFEPREDLFLEIEKFLGGFLGTTRLSLHSPDRRWRRRMWSSA